MLIVNAFLNLASHSLQGCLISKRNGMVGGGAILPNAPPHADERDPSLAKHPLSGIVDPKGL